MKNIMELRDGDAVEDEEHITLRTVDGRVRRVPKYVPPKTTPKILRRGRFIRLGTEWVSIDHIESVWDLGVTTVSGKNIRLTGNITSNMVLDEIERANSCDI